VSGLNYLDVYDTGIYITKLKGTNVKATKEVTIFIRHAQRGPDADEVQVEDQHAESKGYGAAS